MIERQTLTLVLTLAAGAARAESIQVIDARAATITSISLDAPAASLTTVDPNFPNDGELRFEGVGAATACAAAPTAAVTIVAKDQYVFSATGAYLSEHAATFATRMNGRPIAETRGGPVKLVFERTRPAEEFAWYLTACVVGEFQRYELTIASAGKERRLSYPLAPSSPDAVTVIDPPAPRGARPLAAAAQSRRTVRGERLADVLGRLRQGAPPKRLTVTDLGGTVTTLDLQSGSPDVILACEEDGAPIRLASGGPCMLLPAKTQGAAPGPVFFVKKIEVE